MHELTDSTFDAFVAEADQAILVEFWASWCPPCKMMEPMIEKLAAEYNGRCIFAGVNIDRNPNTTEEHDVSGVPTFLLLTAEGVATHRSIGAQTNKSLKRLVDSVLAETRGT